MKDEGILKIHKGCNGGTVQKGKREMMEIDEMKRYSRESKQNAHDGDQLLTSCFRMYKNILELR